MYPAPPGSSPLLGLEVSGEVVAMGEAAQHADAPGGQRAVSDVVCALTNGGGYAEYVSVPAVQTLPLMGNLTPDYRIRAAAFPEGAFTVWHNVFERGRLGAGDAFLVHGGSGGIGAFACRMAREAGAYVVATTSA